jgi:hypothetical protein
MACEERYAENCQLLDDYTHGFEIGDRHNERELAEGPDTITKRALP